MNIKLKEITIYVLTILLNIGLSFLFTCVFFKDSMKYYTFIGLGVILVSYLVISMISTRLNYKLDLLANQIEDQKHLIINSIFIADVLSIPITMFVSLFIN